MIQNFQCGPVVKSSSMSLEQVLEECCKDIGLSNFRLVSILGSGGFGQVYKVKVEYDEKPKILYTGPKSKKYSRKYSREHYKPIDIDIAVKRCEFDDIDEAIFETEFGYYMDKAGIGPKIYYSFYKKINTDVITQYILMEPMDMNAEKALTSLEISISNKLEIVRQMKKILHDQIYEYELFCVDIKPPNFLVNYENKKITKVRMIDFGSQWCYLKSDFDKNHKNIKKEDSCDYVYLIVLIQLCIFYCEYNNRKLLIPIISDPIFKKTDYENYIKTAFNDYDFLLKHYAKHYANSLHVNVNELINFIKIIINPKFPDLYT